MSAFQDKCRQCGKEFKNYNEPIAYRQFCSMGCEADWYRDPPFEHVYGVPECDLGPEPHPGKPCVFGSVPATEGKTDE